MALITPTQVIDLAFTNKNTDQYLVKPTFVEISELNFVRPAIGETLYENISEEVDNGTTWTYAGVTCGVTTGDKTITVSPGTANHIKVHDFVYATELPSYEDDNTGGGTSNCCRGFNKVLSVTLDGNNDIESFEVSGTPKSTNAGASITFKRPNGVLTEDYIRKYLAFCVKFEMMPDMSYNTTSQGVVENVADFTLPVDSSKLNFLRGETFKKSDTYLRRMIEFLNENDEAYPDYCNETEGGVSKKNGIILY